MVTVVRGLSVPEAADDNPVPHLGQNSALVETSLLQLGQNIIAVRSSSTVRS